MYMLFGGLGYYPKDHTKSMQIRLAPHLYNKIRLLSTYLPTNIQLVKCTSLALAAEPHIYFLHLLVYVANLISDMMAQIYFRFLIFSLICISKKRFKHVCVITYGIEGNKFFLKFPLSNSQIPK